MIPFRACTMSSVVGAVSLTVQIIACGAYAEAEPYAIDMQQDSNYYQNKWKHSR